MGDTALIIGITGAFGSGKSTAADFFVSHGYTRVTLSSFLEDEARKRGAIHITRKLLQDLGNEMREKQGKGILAHKALEYIAQEKLTKVVIDGIRNVGEIETLYTQDRFALVGIVTNRDVRFSRLQHLQRRETLTKDLFFSLDYRDLGIGETETGLQVAYCLALSDYFVLNNHTKETFVTDLEKLRHTIEKTV